MEFNRLQHNDLTKQGREFRLDVFLEKIKGHEPFMTIYGEVILHESSYNLFKDNMHKSGLRLVFRTIDDKEIQYPKDFLKSPEFGGKGPGFGTKAEDRHIKSFNDALKIIQECERKQTIKMKIGGKFVNVSSICSTSGTPKSDFHLNNNYGQAVAWISHKDGTKPTHFQQYGGLVKDYDTHYKDNKDVNGFLGKIRKIRPKGINSKEVFYRYVNDDIISKYTIWGSDYGKDRGINNVDEFHQGQMKLVKEKDYYIIDSHHKLENGDIPNGGYKPIYMARYTSDRGCLNINNARIGVFALDKKGGTAVEI